MAADPFLVHQASFLDEELCTHVEVVVEDHCRKRTGSVAAVVAGTDPIHHSGYCLDLPESSVVGVVLALACILGDHCTEYFHSQDAVVIAAAVG